MTTMTAAVLRRIRWTPRLPALGRAAFVARSSPPLLSSLCFLCFLSACSDPPYPSGPGGGSATSSSSGSPGTGGSGGGAPGSGGSGGGGDGGCGGGGAEASLEDILAELRADRDGALLAHAAQTGWPVPLAGGYLFVSTEARLDRVGGDHDAWTGTAMTQDAGFRWVVLPVPAGNHYKFTDGNDWSADPWSRSVMYDDFGEMSLVAPTAAHLDRHFALGDAAVEPRTVRVWVPDEAVDRVLYVQDGQNLFDPAAAWGGWHLQDAAAAVGGSVLLVGIDNTPARLEEYTDVSDQIEQDGSQVGGRGDAYADFLRDTVRPFVRACYGEPGPVGVMGSSLGGLISFHLADRDPGAYAFAASLSGTMGWGSIGQGVHNETMIERYADQTSPVAVLYLDSGGRGSCFDSDGDGIDDDDTSAKDNYCENLQMRGVLTRAGSPYVDGASLFYAWQPDAEHNEAAWAARVAEPLRIFAAL